jgi:hypothetical protein
VDLIHVVQDVDKRTALANTCYIKGGHLNQLRDF